MGNRVEDYSPDAIRWKCGNSSICSVHFYTVALHNTWPARAPLQLREALGGVIYLFSVSARPGSVRVPNLECFETARADGC